MAVTKYDETLRNIQQLTPADQQRLRDALDASEPADLLQARVMSPQALRELLSHQSARPFPPTETEQAAVAAWFEETDRLATRISQEWKGSLSALEAVQEQRETQ